LGNNYPVPYAQNGTSLIETHTTPSWYMHAKRQLPLFYSFQQYQDLNDEFRTKVSKITKRSQVLHLFSHSKIEIVYPVNADSQNTIKIPIAIRSNK
jgi:hypothetical protein